MGWAPLASNIYHDLWYPTRPARIKAFRTGWGSLNGIEPEVAVSGRGSEWHPGWFFFFGLGTALTAE